jgi:voltage-gated potassium channel
MDPATSPEAVAFGRPRAGWRRRWFTVIFEAATPGGRCFDLALLSAVLASVVVVMLETVESLASGYGGALTVIEWAFTLLFTAEYVARLACVERPGQYARSFFGVVDLASVLPMYLALLVPGLHVLIDVRVLRMLRVFRILKLTEYMHEYATLAESLSASRRKIAVFLAAVAMVVVVLGTVMYVIEGPASGFTSIPVAVYWAITTMRRWGSAISPRGRSWAAPSPAE